MVGPWLALSVLITLALLYRNSLVLALPRAGLIWVSPHILNVIAS